MVPAMNTPASPAARAGLLVELGKTSPPVTTVRSDASR
jgi:hypothetical protein